MRRRAGGPAGARRPVTAALALALLAVAGCGGSGSPRALSSSAAPAPTGPVACRTPAADGSDTPGLSGESATDLTVKPAVEVPDQPPPCTLVTRDVVVGTGAVAEPGRRLTVRYVGVTYLGGKEFDASWGGPDFTFPLGAGQVIAGWDQGLVGMRVGGRRELVIPPDLGYGAQGAGPIPPGATLVFAVDLVSVA